MVAVDDHSRHVTALRWPRPAYCGPWGVGQLAMGCRAGAKGGVRALGRIRPRGRPHLCGSPGGGGSPTPTRAAAPLQCPRLLGNPRIRRRRHLHGRLARAGADAGSRPTSCCDVGLCCPRRLISCGGAGRCRSAWSAALISSRSPTLRTIDDTSRSQDLLWLRDSLRTPPPLAGDAQWLTGTFRPPPRGVCPG